MSEIQDPRDQRATLNREVARLTAGFRDAHNKINELMAINERLHKNYSDLIMEVATKHPNETRHETAKRYIHERENRERPVCGSDKSPHFCDEDYE